MRIDDGRSPAALGSGMTETSLRIVHCFRAPAGGVFRHVSDLVEAQHRAGHTVGIVCDSTSGGALEEERLAHLQPYLRLGTRRTPMRRQIAPSDIAATFRLMREVRSLDPDILHAHGAKGGAYARMIGTLLRASGSRVARIYSPHGGSLHYDPRSASGRIYFIAERVLERMTDALIFTSRFEADTYAAKVGPPTRPATIVVNGLQPGEFDPVVPASGARDFLFIGELRDLKGPDVFIAALAEVAKTNGRAPSAWIVGAGTDRPRYEAMVRDLGLAAAVGFRDPMPARQAFAMARAVVVPSRAESMPYIVLEAIATGVPIVATKVGGIPEVFGTAADRLVRPGDATALAAAMERLGASPEAARKEADELRESIRGPFSIERMTRTIEGVYRSLTATPRN
jgi:glycosyltransferase involved in cell wall biosynthesis